MAPSEEVRRSESPDSNRSTSPVDDMNWATEATKSAEKDSRTQPWKKIYDGLVDNTLDPSPDYMTVSSEGGKNVGSRQSKENSLAA
jgi:hypothetical protein